MAARRVHLKIKQSTPAATARVFKLSGVARRRISEDVTEFLKKHKDSIHTSRAR